MQTHLYRTVIKFFVAFALLCGLSISVLAQDQSQYDHGTPPQHVAGVSQVGSYVSADLGTINLGNGSLNFKIPIGEVGGRGFWIPLTLNYSSKLWSANIGTDVVTDPTYRTYPAGYAVYDDPANALDIYNRVAPGWTVGAAPLLRARGMGIYSAHNSTTGCTEYTYVLVKLTLLLPDKGEIELRDDATNGAPLGATYGSDQCRSMDGGRGTRWHATDGSGTVFIADTNNGVSTGNLNGWLITGDGTRYRFQDFNQWYSPSAYLNEFARATSVTDRNGNQVTISYFSSPYAGVQYTDQLGRVTKIEYGKPDPDNPGVTLAALVTLPGYQGQNRYYKIKTDIMNQHYRSGINPTLPVINGDLTGMEIDYTWYGPHTSLFPNSWGGGAERIDTNSVLSQLILPDGRSLNFAYNQFGEVAEVQTPTGGKVQYDYAYVFTLPGGNSMSFEVNPMVGDVRDVDRAVTARRAYPDGNTAGVAESYWTYSYYATHPSLSQTTSGYTDVQAKASDNATLLLNERHYFMDAQRFLSNTGGSGYSLWSTGVERRTETRDGAGSVIAANEQDWSQRISVSWYGYTSYSTEQIANDNRINEARKILETGQTATVHTNYAPSVPYNNPTEVLEYDYDGSLKRRDVTSYVDSSTWINGVDYTSDSVHLISLPLTQTVYDGTGNQVAQITNEYDNYSGDSLHAPLQDYASIFGHDVTYNSSKVTRGNLTAVGRWLNLPSSRVIYSYTRYDIAGNLASTRDPKGNVTTISYSDDFGDGSNPGSGSSGAYGPTYAFPTLITSPPPNAGEAQQTARSQYDFSTGLLTGFLDRNNIKTQTLYNDPFDRPTLVKSALGVGGQENHTRMYYAPTTVYGVTLSNTDAMTVSDQTTVDDAALKSWSHTDGFGRTVDSWTGTPGGDIKVNIIYDGLGRKKQVSNPYRPSLSETATYTTTSYDLAGRVFAVTTPDGAAVNTSYVGNTVTVSDPMSRSRKSVTDALGRLTTVYEDPSVLNYQTSYDYDALNNLKTVNQNGQTRTYVYDSLKRLTSATNPESGTITYSYDDNNDLMSKTDARGVTITYSYDNFNRNSTIDYSNTAINPDITRKYDGATLGKGRFWYEYAGGDYYNGSETNHRAVDSYDAMGRPLVQRQLFKTAGVWGSAYQVQRTYDLTGHVKSQTYPSGHVVNYSYDGAGRTQSFTGNLGEGTQRTYASGITYNQWNQMAVEQFGTTTPLYHKQHFNIRGQQYDLRLSTINDDSNWNRGAMVLYYSQIGGYSGGASNTDNNGNILRAQNWVPSDDYISGWTNSDDWYSYDSLNRLKSVTEYPNNGGTASFVQTYDYDQWGNRTINQSQSWGPIPKPQFTVNTTTNRLGVPAGQSGSMSYDAAGNLIDDSYTGPGYRNYDAENRITTARESNGQQSSFGYSAEGQRVRRAANGQMWWEVYGFDGEVIAEYLAGAGPSLVTKEYGYRNGELLVTAANPAPSNLAFNKPATQSSTFVYSGYTFSANLADNGNTDGSFWDISSSVTNYEYQPWWQVDLGSSQSIQTIHVWPRTDGWYEHTANFYVLVSDNPFSSNDLNTILNQAGVSAYFVSGNVPTPSAVAINRTGRYVRIQRSDSQYLVLAEVEVWSQAISGSADVEWLVSDQQGTPRMIADQTGSLSGIKRHDYLPFGEELSSGVGSRSYAGGYGGADGVRQKFTQYERDTETGLDYAQARYCGSSYGRFTSPDPTLLSVNAFNPQSWNRYAYVLNNPLLYVDPTGLWEIEYIDRYKTKKNRDGTTTQVFDHREVYVRKSKPGDDGASLAKQLGLKGRDAEKFAAKISNGDNIRLATLSGNIGRVFEDVERGLTEQIKWEAAHPGQPGGPQDADCSATACRNAFPQQTFGRGSSEFSVYVADDMISASGATRPVQESELTVGDIARWADARNTPTHFATFIFRDDSGQPVVFSKSGARGSYETATTSQITAKYSPLYGTIRGIRPGEAGYYHPR